MVDNGFRKIGVDAAREDGYRLYWSVGASWGLGKLVEADFSCEFLKKYPKIGVDAAREDGYRLYWSVGASWGLGKLVEADFSCEFLKKYPKVDWGLHYGFGMSSVAVVL
ncbi:hypothetical protein Droror1_Dr00013731 [Drosera rotundifolia]